MGNGPHYGGMGTFTVSKTPLQLAAEQKDIALQNLVAASAALGKAQQKYRELQEAERPCICRPGQCTNCGGKK
jgi:hypothetical protein